MFENFLGMIRKRRRTDSGSAGAGSNAGTTNNDGFFGRSFTVGSSNSTSSSHNNSNTAYASATATASSISSSNNNANSTTFWDSLFRANSTNAENYNEQHQQQRQQQQQQQTTLNTQLVRPFDLNERFVTVLDHLDAHVEKFRKEAMGLQEKRDYLLMSIDLIKSNDLLHTMSETERDEIHTYITRVNSRLGTVELNVRTVRDNSQEDSLSQINALIDMMITLGDPVLSRQRCQQYLNACCSSSEASGGSEHYSDINVYVQENISISGSSGGIGFGMTMETDIGPVDKKFESVLLGCTLDDQKNIKKRLQALMDYLNKQTISH